MNTKEDEIKIKHPNRIKRQNPKKGRMYCYGCDANFVSDSEKCKICGHRRLKKLRFKKVPLLG